MESISVVIPTYNRREVLVRTLNAFADQDIQLTYEVIVCDDGSSDDTTDTVMLMTRDSSFELRYLRHERAGWRLAATRNMGIAAAKGSLIVFSDDDIIPPPSYLSAHYEAHHTPRTVTVGYNYALLSDKERGCTLLGQDVRDREFAAFPELARPLWSLMSGGNFSVEHALLDEVGHFDERFQGWGVEDGELAYRLARVGARFVLEKKAYGWHQYNPNPVSHRLQHAQGLRPDFTSHLKNVSLFRSTYPEDMQLQLQLHRVMLRLELEQSRVLRETAR
ncbi:MAG TPA: glycosyltransferase [Ktedonobacteraceae bacterium]|nr:glycosyltransferase [Ktedonobacteraceae bacterium]